MKEKKEIVTNVTKPEFKGEIKAEIKGLAKIEDNIKEVNKFALELNKYYKTVIWTEDTLKDAKEEKSNVNKFKDKVAEFRKNIINEYNKPIALFETTAKETETILKETYETINNQVKKYEDETKEKIKNEVEEYFKEYKEINKIDFVNYDQANINVTLSASMKSLKEQVKTFIDKIVSDIELINEEELKTEILVEYKKTLNASASILEVKRRVKAIEEEKIRQEELSKVKEQEQIIVEKVEKAIEIVEYEIPVEINTPPIVVNEETPEDLNEMFEGVTFTITGTRLQIRNLKEYMKVEGIKYE